MTDDEFQVNGIIVSKDQFLCFLKEAIKGDHPQTMKFVRPKLGDSRDPRKANYILSLKLEAYAAYGGARCVCCGETELVFLSFEHANRDGSLLRKIHGGGLPFYEWLKSHGYPKDLGLEILCMNCQFGRKFNGICPHQGREVI